MKATLLTPWTKRAKRRSTCTRVRSTQRGAASVELALLVPALMIMLGLLFAGGRLWFARATVTEAAHSSARAASLARSAGEAGFEGRSAVRQSLSTAGMHCSNTLIDLNLAAFDLPVGTPATISATVTCNVPFTDILLPGMPGSITLHGTGSSALDTYRSRR